MNSTVPLALMCLLLAGMAFPQTVTETLRVPSSPLDTKWVSVAAAQANEQSSFIVENSTSGGGTIDALSLDACAVISLVTPGSVNINAANAVSLGYGYDRQTIGSGSLYLGIFGLPGTHTTFRIPPTAGNGAFKVRVDAASCTSAIAVRAVYASVSTVQLAPIVPPRAVARNVSLAVGGVVLDDGNTVLGATLSASISTTTDISAQVQLQNYQLQSQTTLPDSTIETESLVPGTLAEDQSGTSSSIPKRRPRPNFKQGKGATPSSH